MEQRTEQVTYRVIIPASGNVLTNWDGKDILSFGYFDHYEAPYDASIEGIHEIPIEAAIELKKEADRRVAELIASYRGPVEVSPFSASTIESISISGATI